MSDAHDHPPDAFGSALTDRVVRLHNGNSEIQHALEVTLSAETLAGLSRRAVTEDRGVGDVIADALRQAAGDAPSAG